LTSNSVGLRTFGLRLMEVRTWRSVAANYEWRISSQHQNPNRSGRDHLKIAQRSIF
jgi:hypothetical protein